MFYCLLYSIALRKYVLKFPLLALVTDLKLTGINGYENLFDIITS